MKTIIVATDLSDRSDKAVARALALAKQHDAKCHVVSVVDDALPVKVSEQLVETIKDSIADSVDGTDAEVSVLRGEITEMLSRFATMNEADLLVLGLHRPRFFLDGLRQTTMERLVVLSPVPVLLVRNDTKGAYENALVPVSFSRSCAAALRAVKRVAPDAATTAVHALHVPYTGFANETGRAEMEEAVRRETEELCSEWEANSRLPDDYETPEIVAGAVRMVIDEKLSSTKPDLLAIGAHTRSGLSLHALGGFAGDLVRDPPTDLLVAKPRNS